MRRLKWVVMAVLTILVFWAGMPDVASAKEARIRIGAIKAIGTVVPFVAERLGYLDDKEIDIQVTTFMDGPTVMQAFATGNIDIAYLGVAPSAIWWSKGMDLKVVASTNSGGHVLLTRADTGIKTLKDLKGRHVAVPSTGSVTDTIFRALMMKQVARLDPERDLKLFPGMAGSDMPTALMVTREVEAIVTWEPFIAQAEEKYPDVLVLFDTTAYWRERHNGENYPVNVVVARGDFIRKNEKLLKQFLAIHKKTVDFINNSPVQANQIIAEELNLSTNVVIRARTRTDFTYKLDIPAMMIVLGFSKDLGYLKQLPDPEEFFAPSYLNDIL
ncbi:MAG: ABC transporter substrate-binding protein [Syntrophothermus sp.]